MKKYLLSLFVCVSGFLISCSNDAAIEQINEKDSISFDLKTSIVENVAKIDPETRATEEGNNDKFNENEITKLAVFFYNGETQVWYPEAKYNKITKRVTVPLISAPADFIDKTYDVYVVINSPKTRAEMTGKTLTELKNMVITADFDVKNRKVAQTNFVMDGSILSKTVFKQSPYLGEVNINRAAAKIRVRISIGSRMQANSPGTPAISVKNYMTKGAMLQGGTIPVDGLTSDADYADASVVHALGGFVTAAPVYSYPRSWSDNTNATYVVIKLNMTVAGVARDYYYKVFVNPTTKRLYRNFIYDIAVNINDLGGDEQEPLIITGQYEVTPWLDKDAYGTIFDNQYLVVEPQELTVLNATTDSVYYYSTKNIEIVNFLAQYDEYNTTVGSTGNKVTIANMAGPLIPVSGVITVPLTSGGSVKLTLKARTVVIESPKPTNFLPRYISFTVRHTGVAPTSPFNKKVEVTQYPPIYITSTKGISSNLYGSTLPSGLTNNSIYKIKMSVPDKAALAELGLSANYSIGFPELGPQSYYNKTVVSVTDNNYNLTTADNQNIISPSFELASQYGATTPMVYFVYNGYANPQSLFWNGSSTTYTYTPTTTVNKPASASFNCSNYQETRRKSDGTTEVLSNWRLPTVAEINLINAIQRKTGSPVYSIMTGRFYWGNNSTTVVDLGTGNANSPGSVRCVRDVKTTI